MTETFCPTDLASKPPNEALESLEKLLYTAKREIRKFKAECSYLSPELDMKKIWIIYTRALADLTAVKDDEMEAVVEGALKDMRKVVIEGIKQRYTEGDGGCVVV